MANCHVCSGPLRETALFCDRCGSEVSAGENAATIATPERTSRGHDGARFVPGTVLDRRYRIVAPIGRGGMGEVYRADDLKLGQPVALKFLPRSLEQDPERLELLLEEVKCARQVSHLNVCRVWDVGESDGLHFVAMEYVDGEDLGSLLRRIGRLPEDRGVLVAREICAGLAAIHDQGLVHRDLKPTNVMLDGRGHARITDFGLAARADTIGGGDIRSGTPAYMAPETLAGREVTARSDIYALGLLLHELFTGRHAFSSGRTPTPGATESRPDVPSSRARTLDPVVERAILRCLEADPADRPSSARAVAQALPGGDPLVAAALAGETPSPGMVAAAGGVGGLSTLAAIGGLAFSAAALVGVLLLSEARGLPFGPEDKPYAALQDRATEVMRAMGSAVQGGDMQDGFSRVRGTGHGVAPGATRRDVFYWQRRSPTAVLPGWDERLSMGGSKFALPALTVPGEVAVRYDLQGRLLEFRRYPAGDDSVAGTADWGPLLAAAGITTTPRANEVPRAPTPVPTDMREAWVAVTPRGELQLEGGTYRGVVTYFSAGPPYALPAIASTTLVKSTSYFAILLLLFAISILVARRNLTVGRADLGGALRISGCVWLGGVFGYDLLATPRITWPGGMLLGSVAISLFFAAFVASCYMALEPIVRRRRPQWLASWSRLLEGRWLDPLVGRHAVIGAMAGLTLALTAGLQGYLAGTAAAGDYQAAAVGGWTTLGVLSRGSVDSFEYSLVFILALVLLQIAARQDRFAFVAWAIWAWLVAATQLLGASGPTEVMLALLQAAVLGVVLHRFGVLPFVIAQSVRAWFNEEYLTVHLGAWYSGVTVAALLMTAALLTWGIVAGLRTTRGPRRLNAGAEPYVV